MLNNQRVRKTTDSKINGQFVDRRYRRGISVDTNPKD